jgi:nucleoside-diphosphate-sugar epimerase
MYLITGSTGMTGLAVLEYLVSIGYTKKVKCIVRSSSDLSKHDHIKIPIEYIEWDIECLVVMPN